jgi:uncharacterized membrane protein
MQLSDERLVNGSTQRPPLRELMTLPPGAWLFVGLIVASVVALVAAPWSADLKFRAVLHGLCAQRPSHSFALGGVNLPFDARMAGIYGGVLTTLGFLVARGRWRAVQLPGKGQLATLVLFVAIMGIDGVNSTLQDFGLPYAYEPQNWLRLATGLLTGVALGVMLLYLLNATLWAWVKPAPLVTGWGEVGTLVALASGFGLLVASGWGWLYLPLATGLTIGAVSAVLTLALTLLVLIYGRENRARQATELAGFASVALLLGYAVMALIAVGRWYLETTLGVVLPL